MLQLCETPEELPPSRALALAGIPPEEPVDKAFPEKQLGTISSHPCDIDIPSRGILASVVS
jgi:hypothetical protein